MREINKILVGIFLCGTRLEQAAYSPIDGSGDLISGQMIIPERQ